MRKWLRRQMKRKSRIYIMPTRMGGYLNGLIFLMFLLSVGYSNNLLLIFTLLLFGLNLIWVIQTHFHLHALKLQNLSIVDSHAGESALVKVFWKKAPDGPHQWQMELSNETLDVPMVTMENGSREVTAQMTLDKRGVFDFDNLMIRSEMPFGLYQTWIYFPVSVRAWVYPAKLKEIPQVPSIPSNTEGDFSSLKSGPHDVWNLGPYQGEESRKISWKHYARTGDLVIKEGEDLTETTVHFELKRLSENKELTLSTIATQMVMCSRNETAFSFATLERKFHPAKNEKHLTDCLRELAKC